MNILLREVVFLALDMARSNKMRSALTVRVVIGITAIVVDDLPHPGFRPVGSATASGAGRLTVFLAKFSGVSSRQAETSTPCCGVPT